MNDKLQIIYMQTRLVRLAADVWNVSVDEANRIFTDNGIYKYISDYWDIFHVESDMAVLDDITERLNKKKVAI